MTPHGRAHSVSMMGRRTARPRSFSAALSVCASLAFASVAEAAPPKMRAELLFREGIAASERGDHDIACGKFRESQLLRPAPGTLFNLAHCEELRGRLASAVEAFEELLRSLPPADKRAAEVRRRIGSLDPAVPRLRIKLAKGAPPSTVVTRNGEAVENDALGTELRVDPGPQTIVAKHGDRSQTFSLNLAPADRKTLEVRPFDPPPAPPPVPPEDRSGLRAAALVAGGIGVVGLGVAAFAGVRITSLDRELSDLCDLDKNGDTKCYVGRAEEARARELSSAGNQMSTIGTIGLVTGIVGVGAAVVLYLTSRSKSTPTLSTAIAVNRSWIGIGRSF